MVQRLIRLLLLILPCLVEAASCPPSGCVEEVPTTPKQSPKKPCPVRSCVNPCDECASKKCVSRKTFFGGKRRCKGCDRLVRCLPLADLPPAKCCSGLKPSRAKCGKTGCKCCSNGKWVPGNFHSAVKVCGVVGYRRGRVCPRKCCKATKKKACGKLPCACCSNGQWVKSNLGSNLKPIEVCAQKDLRPSRRCRGPSNPTTTVLPLPKKQLPTTTPNPIDRNMTAFGPMYSTLARKVMGEHNKLRKSPKSYIPVLERYLSKLDPKGNIKNGCGHNCTKMTMEGKASVRAAIRFLRNQKPLPPLKYNKVLSDLAKTHANYQISGHVGHNGAGGITLMKRIEGALPGTIAYGENLSYGQTKYAQEIVRDLLIDDGVPDRAGRKILLSSTFDAAGVGCGPHKLYKVVCVLNYAKI